MGYTTDFDGAFIVSPPLSEEHAAELAAFAAEDHRGGRETDYHAPGMPEIWCQWVPGSSVEPASVADRVWDVLEWDGGEKFYAYVEWMEYLIEHFLAPWGHTVNGTVTWQGEESDDMGRIVVTDNVVKTQHAEVSYADD